MKRERRDNTHRITKNIRVASSFVKENQANDDQLRVAHQAPRHVLPVRIGEKQVRSQRERPWPQQRDSVTEQSRCQPELVVAKLCNAVEQTAKGRFVTSHFSNRIG